MRTTGVGALPKRFKKAVDSAPVRKKGSRPPILAKAMSGPEWAPPSQVRRKLSRRTTEEIL